MESVIAILFRLHCFNEQGFLIHIKCTLDLSVVVVVVFAVVVVVFVVVVDVFFVVFVVKVVV